ncbi:MAG TPA: hypothetical protein VJZ69_02060 [Clostridia bacterium]|nr:hypothetical protein [Clostridia bacterium]
MNIVFLLLSLASLAMLMINSPDTVFPIMIGGATSAIELILKLLAIYSVWLSVLKMMERTGADKLIAKILRPVTKRLFKGESEDAQVFISINFASNILGMGGASTPAGIKAMREMHKSGDTASPNMILFLVIAATSIQFFPATVIALRSTAGSANASDILLPTLISSASSTAIAIILCKVFGSISKPAEKVEKKGKIRFRNASLDTKLCNNIAMAKANTPLPVNCTNMENAVSTTNKPLPVKTIYSINNKTTVASKNKATQVNATACKNKASATQKQS